MSDGPKAPSMAHRFYGPSDAPATEQPADRTERTEQDIADTLYGDPKVLAKSYAPHLADAANRLRDHAGMTSEQYERSIEDAAVVFTDAGIPSDRAARLYDAIVEHTINRPDDATVEQWSVESRQQLRERYGADEADRRLAAAAEFVKQRPGLASLLRESGMGSHPEFVLALAANPSALRVTPRPRR